MPRLQVNIVPRHRISASAAGSQQQKAGIPLVVVVTLWRVAEQSALRDNPAAWIGAVKLNHVSKGHGCALVVKCGAPQSIWPHLHIWVIPVLQPLIPDAPAINPPPAGAAKGVVGIGGHAEPGILIADQAMHQVVC